MNAQELGSFWSKGKYPDGDTWLGTSGWRSYSVSGEWPGSYHGTSLKGATGIVRRHYKAGEGGTVSMGEESTQHQICVLMKERNKPRPYFEDNWEKLLGETA